MNTHFIRKQNKIAKAKNKIIKYIIYKLQKSEIITLVATISVEFLIYILGYSSDYYGIFNYCVFLMWIVMCNLLDSSTYLDCHWSRNIQTFKPANIQNLPTLLLKYL